MTRLVDLSHQLEDGMAAYPGLPTARIGAILDHDASRERYEGKAEFYLGRIEIAANTGTYLDAPFHRHRDADDLSDLARPVHTEPLGAGIPIVENLRGLEGLPADDFTFSAPPLAIPRGVTTPVRAYAEIPT